MEHLQLNQIERETLKAFGGAVVGYPRLTTSCTFTKNLYWTQNFMVMALVALNSKMSILQYLGAIPHRTKQ